MPPVGFELTISAGERPKTYALDRAATGTGSRVSYGVDKTTCFGLLGGHHQVLQMLAIGD